MAGTTETTNLNATPKKSSRVVPARVCCVCKTLKPVTDLIRVARVNGEYMIDKTRKIGGRGCHVCAGCIDKCVKTRAINRSFKTNVPQKIYDELLTCKPK